MDQITEHLWKFFDAFHFSNEFFSISVFIICGFYLIKVLKRFHDEDLQDWSDIITQNGPSNKVSLTKVMQLCGLFISSWVVVHMTVFGKLTYDIFGLYLAYVGGSEGFSKYLKAKHGNKDEDLSFTQIATKTKRQKKTDTSV